jgi:FAD:protein FMN transferase
VGHWHSKPRSFNRIADEERLLDVIFVQDAAVVSSGDYQRYYIVNGQVLHHIIDPETLMPGSYYRAITVVADDAALADVLSTALFLLPFEESKELAATFENVEVYWVFHDGKVEITEGMKSMLRSYGATNEKQ